MACKLIYTGSASRQSDACEHCCVPVIASHGCGIRPRDLNTSISCIPRAAATAVCTRTAASPPSKRRVLKIVREDDLPGSEASAAWLTYLRGGPAANLHRVAAHNHHDVVTLARLTLHLQGH